MVKTRLYLDTSVIGALYDTEDPKRVNIAKTLQEKIEKGDYEAYISRLFLEEIMKAPEDIREDLISVIKALNLPILEEVPEILKLAEIFVEEGIIPEKYRDDARHIAIAVFYQLDLLVSWNYKHMVNVRVKNQVNSVSLRMGYKRLDIVSPEEVIEYGEMEL
jgi:predicted nucleic acid-binding protein